MVCSQNEFSLNGNGSKKENTLPPTVQYEYACFHHINTFLHQYSQDFRFQDEKLPKAVRNVLILFSPFPLFCLYSKLGVTIQLII